MLLWIPDTALPVSGDDVHTGAGIWPARVEYKAASVYWTIPSLRSFVVSYACDGSHLPSTTSKLTNWQSSSFYVLLYYRINGREKVPDPYGTLWLSDSHFT
jgi:hypothetical protein